MLDYAKKYEGYVIGDWLINYQAGFVRRGLTGQLIIALSDLIHLKMNMVVFAIQLLFYLAYSVILYFLIYKKEITGWFLVLLLSPVTLLFPILGAAGRKEMILFFLFGLYIICLDRNRLKSTAVLLLFSLALMVATLIHELTFFYIPYFILAAYFKSKIDNKPFQLSKAALIAIGPLVAVAAIFLFGKNIDGAAICNGLMQRGLPDTICKGVLSWPADFNIFSYALSNSYLFTYPVALILGLIPFIYFYKTTNPQQITWKTFCFTFFFSLLFSLPLFVLAIDWGRWINIHFIMFLFSSTLFLNNKSADFGIKPFAFPALLKATTPLSKQLNTVLFFVLIIGYTTFWGMKCFGTFSVFSLDFYKVFLNLFHGLLSHL